MKPQLKVEEPGQLTLEKASTAVNLLKLMISAVAAAAIWMTSIQLQTASNAERIEKVEVKVDKVFDVLSELKIKAAEQSSKLEGIDDKTDKIWGDLSKRP